MSEKLITTPEGLIRMVDPTTGLRAVPPQDYKKALEQGMRPQTKEEYVKSFVAKKFEERGLEAGALGVLSGVTGGLSTAGIRKLAPGYEVDNVLEHNSGAAFAGDLAGTIGSALTGVGVAGTAAKLGAKAGAKAMAKVASIGGKQVAGPLTKAAVEAGERVVKSPGLMGRAAASVSGAATRGAVEGGILGASHGATSVLFKDGYDGGDALEQMVYGGGKGALAGGTLDGVAGGIAGALKSVSRKAVHKVGLSRVGELATVKRNLEVLEKQFLKAKEQNPSLISSKMDNGIGTVGAGDLGSQLKKAREAYLTARVQMGTDVAAAATAHKLAANVTAWGAGHAVGTLTAGPLGGLVGGGMATQVASKVIGGMKRGSLESLVRKIAPGGIRRGVDEAAERAEFAVSQNFRKKYTKYAFDLRKNDAASEILGTGTEVAKKYHIGEKQIVGEVAADLAASVVNKAKPLTSSITAMAGVAERLGRYAPKAATIYAMKPEDVSSAIEAIHGIDPESMQSISGALSITGLSAEEMDAIIALGLAGIEKLKQNAPLAGPGGKLTRQDQVKFKNRLAVQVDPLSIIDRLISAQATADEIDQLAAVAPDLHAALREMAEDAMDAHMASGETIGSNKQRTLELMLQGKTDTRHAITLQQAYGQQNNAQAIKEKNRRVDIASKTKSNADRVAEGDSR